MLPINHLYPFYFLLHAVKSKKDRDGLWEALLDDRIDVIATDHAPHTIEEKRNMFLFSSIV